MTRAKLAWAILVPVALIGYFFVASMVSYGPEEAAEGIAKDYLEAACGQANDRGWSMLVGDQRDAEFGSREHYLDRARRSSCGSFIWQLASTTCDDGVCVIWLSVPDEAAIPGFLAESGIVGWRTDKVPPGANAGMAVLQRWIIGQGVIVPDL